MDRKVNQIFQPADILLPAEAEMSRWSVIACDQFTSDAAYWRRVEEFVGGAPSTLRLMLPEYYLGKCDEQAATKAIQATMERYLSTGVFRTVEQSFIYLERTLPSGAIRRGIVGQVDLEAYDFSPDSNSPIRATEGTVESRLPPRVKVRSAASMEMPHIMLFLNDADDTVMRSAKTAAGETLYDFDLMENGGHVRGRRIGGEAADKLADVIEACTSDSATLQFAVGDGNHSLAAARKFWLETKAGLTDAEAARHPARYALVELVNIHDDAITFAPIHRVIFNTASEQWFSEAESALVAPFSARTITLLAGNERKTISAKGASIGELIASAEAFCQAFCKAHGGEIDYIHGDDETITLSGGVGCCGMLLPQMEKSELFSSVEETGPFPKKSFSIGLGRDKRYYLECRKIKL